MRHLVIGLLCSVLVLTGCATTQSGNLVTLRQQSDHDYAVGQLKRAAEGYTHLTAIDHNDPVLWARLGNTQALLGHPRRAADAYDQALRLKPDLAAVRYNLAMLRLRQAQAQLIAASATPQLPASLQKRIQAMQEVMRQLDEPKPTHPDPISP